MSYRRKLWISYILASLLVFGLVAFFPKTRWLQAIDDGLRTFFYQWSSQNEYGVVVVAIDEKSFATLKTNPAFAAYHQVAWPWPPSLHAQLVTRLAAHGADRIGFDLLFSEAYEQVYLPEYATAGPLLEAFQQTGIPVVLASKRDRELYTEPRDVYLKAGFGSGLANVPLSAIGDIRSFRFLHPEQKESLPLALARAEGGDRNLEALGWTREKLNAAQHLTFRGPEESGFPVLSFTDVILGKLPGSIQGRWGKANLSELLRGKAVLIGQTSIEAHDIHLTPLGQMPGVLIHAHALEMLLQPAQKALKEIGPRAGYAMIAGTLGLSIVLTLTGSGIVWLLLRGFLAFGYWILAFFLFRDLHLILPLVEILLAFFLNGILCQLFSGVIERREKLFLHGVFGKYVSPGVAKKLLADPQSIKLGGEEREITILFSDIAGFTTISEQLSSQDLIALLNEYLGMLTNEIMDRDGTLDKYIGDAIMAFWGAPFDMKNHAEMACISALAMQKKSREFNQSTGKTSRPEMNCRIGINTGLAVVGNAGSHQRFSYTAIGDAVNTASRFEGLGKKYGVFIIIGEATRRQVGDSFDVRLLDRVKVKGKTEARDIFELLGSAGQADRAFLDLHQRAMNAYFLKNWAEAKPLFELKFEKYKDEHSSLFLKRIEELMSNEKQAEAFDGSWALIEK